MTNTKKMTYQAKIDFYLDDAIPCQIAVIDYTKVKGDKSTWASDVDFYGYEEFDYDLLDLDGKVIKPDLTDSEVEQIEQAIAEHFEVEYDC